MANAIGRSFEGLRSLRPLLSIQSAQFSLGGLQSDPSLFRELAASPINVKCQHRHRRAKWVALAPVALLGGALERPRYPARVVQREHPFFQIERIARLCNAL